MGSNSEKRLFAQETYEARDGFTELQGWIYAFFWIDNLFLEYIVYPKVFGAPGINDLFAILV